jgi:hypothetical protein
MRKIGYSVGLESSLSRLADTAEEYRNNKKLTITMWNSMVRDKWGLKNDNIGDFFFALGILNRSRAGLEVQAGLDTMAIILESLGSSNPDLLKLPFLASILENDGEIFCNCLEAGFESHEVERLLTSAIEYKRSKLWEIYKNPEVRNQIAHVVTVERQSSNTGSASDVKKGGLRERPTLVKRGVIPSIEFSEDYFRKVPPRRRDWAIDIGLFDASGHKTEQHAALRTALDQRGCILGSGAVVLWPFSHETSRLRLNPVTFEGKILDYWDLVKFSMLGAGGRVLSEDEGASSSHLSKLMEVLRKHWEIYQGLNLPKAILRREIPVTVAYLTVASEYLVSGLGLPNLPALVLAAQHEENGLRYRSSRNSLGTISFA